MAIASGSNNTSAYSPDGINWVNVVYKVVNPAGTDTTADLNEALGVNTVLSNANTYTDSAVADKATMTEVNTAIQSAIQNTWEASY